MTRHRHFLLFLLLASPAFAQAPARDNAAAPGRTGTGNISGTVVTDEAAGRPLRRAVVTISGSALVPGRAVITDDQGRFAVGNLPEGNFTVSAGKQAYVTMAYGQKRAGRGTGAPIALGPGQRVDNIVITLPRGAVLSGTIADEGGQPRRGAIVSILHYVTTNGARRLERVPPQYTGGLFNAVSDDRGAFRVYGLPAGEYVISASVSGFESSSQTSDLRRVTAAELQWADQQLRASGPGSAAAAAPSQTPAPPSGQTIAFATVYYPGTTDAAGAVSIKLDAGMERSGLDFPVGLVPTAKLEGTVTGPDGQPPANVIMTAVRDGGDLASPLETSVVTARPDREGRFTMVNVTPGRYTIHARTPTASSMPTLVNGVLVSMPSVPAGTVPGLWGTLDVSVNGQDLRGLTIALQPGLTFSGRVVFEGTTLQPPTNPGTYRVILTPPQAGGSTASMPAPGQTRPDGTFEIAGIMPGRYRVTASITTVQSAQAAATWTLKSALVGANDVADSVLEIRPGESISDAVVTFTDQAAEVSGTLTDTMGRPTPDYHVVIFSTDKSTWTSGSRRVKPPARPATNGRFRIANLPPGEYYLAALTAVEPRDMNDTTFLEQTAGSAIKITLGVAEKKVQDVKLAAP